MKKLLIALVLLSSCLGSIQVQDYGVCLDTQYPTTVCEPYYEWIAGWWTISGEYRGGYYRLRPGYTMKLRDRRIWIERDHRAPYYHRRHR